MSENKEMGIIEKAVATLKDTFVPDNTPNGKRKHDQVGNNLFQDVVVAPYAAALKYQKELGPRVLTSSQAKRKAKNRAKTKVQKASRKRNRK